MSGYDIASGALLAAATLLELICVAGVAWFDDPFDQLHYAGAATTLGPLLLAAAVVITGFPQKAATVECVTALVLSLLLGPTLTIATGRAERRRRYGDLVPRAHELRKRPQS